MADFKPSYSEVLKSEGGYHNGYIGGKKDLGGETYKGISRVYNPSWSGWAIIDKIKAQRTIKNNEIINDSALDKIHYDFSKKSYWDKIKGDEIKSQEFANFLFDFYWHSPKNAIETLQDVAKVPKTGVMNSDTLSAINKSADSLYPKYFQARQDFYKSGKLGTSFIDAWIKRVKRFPSSIKGIATSTYEKVKGQDTKTLIIFSALSLISISLGVYYIYKKKK